MAYRIRHGDWRTRKQSSRSITESIAASRAPNAHPPRRIPCASAGHEGSAKEGRRHVRERNAQRKPAPRRLYGRHAWRALHDGILACYSFWCARRSIRKVDGQLQGTRDDTPFSAIWLCRRAHHEIRHHNASSHTGRLINFCTGTKCYHSGVVRGPRVRSFKLHRASKSSMRAPGG
ncbi:hypothetical protein EI94DRAFT_1014854 [Lactarius quietus]|nr:hypothetical protein EI94DRAFT_1014854 [Lactarius quietus]